MSTKRITSLLTVGALALASLVTPARGEETVKVGVLHSLSGTMAISETSLRDVLLFTFDEINAKGGVLGKKIEPVVVDGASNWPLFAEKSKQLLEQDKVAVTFGCWTSVSRKSCLPVFEKNNGLLFYPVQYEGEEESKNVAYTAEAVNQQATPAIDYLLAQGVKKFYLLGSDYVYPQTTNLVLLEYLLSKGVPLANIGGGFRKDASGKIISAGKYTPFGHTDYQQIVAEIKQFSAGGGAAVVSTLTATPTCRSSRSTRLPASPPTAARWSPSPSRRMSSAVSRPISSWASSVAGPTSSRSTRPRTRSSSPTSRPGSRRARCPASSRKAA